MKFVLNTWKTVVFYWPAWWFIYHNVKLSHFGMSQNLHYLSYLSLLKTLLIKSVINLWLLLFMIFLWFNIQGVFYLGLKSVYGMCQLEILLSVFIERRGKIYSSTTNVNTLVFSLFQFDLHSFRTLLYTQICHR